MAMAEFDRVGFMAVESRGGLKRCSLAQNHHLFSATFPGQTASPGPQSPVPEVDVSATGRNDCGRSASLM